jgi:tripartite motif-containing protein 71
MNTHRLVLILFFLILAALTASTALAASFYSNGSGAWNAPAVWGAAAMLGSSGTGDGQFNAATALAADDSGNVYVSEINSNNRIQKFDTNGNFILKFGSSGTGDGQFDHAYGITATSGAVYVADFGHERVVKFDSNGNFISTWGWGVQDGTNAFQICTSGCRAGIQGSGAGEFANGLEGIDLDSDGNVYVSEINSNNRIQKFDSGGNFIAAWGWGVSDGANHYEICTSNCQAGIIGTGDGQLHHPTHVGVHGTNVYVADYLNNRIVQYDTSGNFIAAWGWGVADGANHYEICTSNCQAGTAGSGDGQFNIPEEFAFDASGNVYEADLAANRIQKFTSTGTFITKWGSTGTAPGQFNGSPFGLAIDSNGNVWASDGTRVERFDENGNFALFTDCSLSSSCVAGTDYPGSSDSVTLASGSTVTVPASDSFSLGALNILAGGTLSQGAGSTLTLSGFWSNAGTYTAASDANVVLNGSNQLLLGNTTFANLTKSVSSADTLSFDANSTIAVSGNLSLNGVLGNLLSLVKMAFAIPVWSSEFTYTPSDYPSSIAVDEAGNTYVGDCGSNPAVYKFDPSGTLTQTFGAGTISCSYGVAVDADGNIYVGDNSLLRKYNSSGTEVAHWGPDGVGGSGSFGFNTGVVVENGKIYAADCAGTPNAAIDVFDTDGHFLSSFGAGTLACPYYINADSEGNIYVPDENPTNTSLNPIYKYSPDGTLLLTIPNVPGGGFVEAVAVDAAGFIYAANYKGAQAVQMADPNGNFLTSFGSVGTGHGKFSFADPPITFDSQGNLYTVDNKLDFRIQKFSPGSSPSTWNISAGSTDFSFLSVSNSTAASAFTCTNGCVDGGGNTNWVFTVPTPPPTPAVVSSGGGWSGGCSTYPQGELPSWGVVPCMPTNATQGAAVLPGGIQTWLTAPATQHFLQSQGSTLQNVGGITLTKNHQLYDVSSDIKFLQQFLNTHGFTIAKTGPGSTSNETTFFGSKTYQALIKFQKANGILATGYLGPLTRALINLQAH